MYTPAHFRIDDLDECFDIVERRGVGTLVVAAGGGLEASLLPWIVERGPLGHARLLGHFSKANPLAPLFEDPAAALVVVDLVDGYVSPSWYAAKAEHHRVVPTWNYVSVHLHGTARLVRDAGWVRRQVTALTDVHEADLPAPWAVADAPEEFIATMINGIVGIEFVVERVEGKAKLSQNRSAADRAGVHAALAGHPSTSALAGEMMQRSLTKEGQG
jgi:transcriptional regulator